MREEEGEEHEGGGRGRAGALVFVFWRGGRSRPEPSLHRHSTRPPARKTRRIRRVEERSSIPLVAAPATLPGREACIVREVAPTHHLRLAFNALSTGHSDKESSALLIKAEPSTSPTHRAQRQLTRPRTLARSRVVRSGTSRVGRVPLYEAPSSGLGAGPNGVRCGVGSASLRVRGGRLEEDAHTARSRGACQGWETRRGLLSCWARAMGA
ncbi:hypothetical protein DMC30DRAFT_236400 [Rhodotorula diobovata]|uniref:Uncharacterized protein n=1 Tax=Rhodotorula diobovata TaxID=5288 RepID=A0A5C5FV58_9BASI|nr:hypothetical protein DMC30DRAFT_236400 [Rhodotorula diobovata]